MAVSIEDIKKAIKGILKGADLDNLSTKKVRKELEEKFSTDLTKRKKEIDGLVMQMITENEEEEEEAKNKEKDKEAESGSESEGLNGAGESESEEEVPKKKAKKSSSSASSKSDDKKKKKSASRADDSEDPVMSSIGDMNDEDLARKLQEEEEFGYGGRTRRRAAPPPKKEKKKKVKDPSEKKNTGFSRPMILSEKLAKVVGANEMPRSEVVKTMWNIIKERDLKDPKNGQYMICDEQLQDLFGKKKVRTFSMMKYLSSHIKDPDHVLD